MNFNKKTILLFFALFIGCNLMGEPSMTKVKLTTESGKSVLFELNDSSTSRSLIEQLPTTMEFEDYARTEKITYPSPKLSTQNTPSGYNPSVGDFCLYGPWGNICIFYKDFGYASGLIHMGSAIEGAENIKLLQGKVKLELIK